MLEWDRRFSGCGRIVVDLDRQKMPPGSGSRRAVREAPNLRSFETATQSIRRSGNTNVKIVTPYRANLKWIRSVFSISSEPRCATEKKRRMRRGWKKKRRMGRGWKKKRRIERGWKRVRVESLVIPLNETKSTGSAGGIVKLCPEKNQVYAPVGFEIPNHGAALCISFFCSATQEA